MFAYRLGLLVKTEEELVASRHLRQGNEKGLECASFRRQIPY